MINLNNSFYALVWAFLQFETEQSHLLTNIWSIFKITTYKIYQLSYASVSYFMFIVKMHVDLLNFKVRMNFLGHHVSTVILINDQRHAKCNFFLME